MNSTDIKKQLSQKYQDITEWKRGSKFNLNSGGVCRVFKGLFDKNDPDDFMQVITVETNGNLKVLDPDDIGIYENALTTEFKNQYSKLPDFKKALLETLKTKNKEFEYAALIDVSERCLPLTKNFGNDLVKFTTGQVHDESWKEGVYLSPKDPSDESENACFRVGAEDFHGDLLVSIISD